MARSIFFAPDLVDRTADDHAILTCNSISNMLVALPAVLNHALTSAGSSKSSFDLDFWTPIYLSHLLGLQREFDVLLLRFFCVMYVSDLKSTAATQIDVSVQVWRL